MAAGDASRLQSPVPKALFNLEIKNNETLMKIFIQRIKSLLIALQVQQQIPIYFKISKNHRKSFQDYLIQNNFFDYQEIHLIEVEQDYNIQDLEGNLVFDKNKNILKSAIGNGQIINVFEEHLLQKLQDKGIEIIHFSNIDNLLVRPCDPVYIQELIENNYDILHKTIIKKTPQELVGEFGQSRDRPFIREYIYVTEIFQQERFANLNNFFMKIEALKRIIANKDRVVSSHQVIRKFDIFDLKIKEIKYQQPCIKTEIFFMDYFQFENNDEFAPIKSLRDYGSLEQAKNMFGQFFSKYKNNHYSRDDPLYFYQSIYQQQKYYLLYNGYLLSIVKKQTIPCKSYQMEKQQIECLQFLR